MNTLRLITCQLEGALYLGHCLGTPAAPRPRSLFHHFIYELIIICLIIFRTALGGGLPVGLNPVCLSPICSFR